jgi:hypothetical protein
MAVFELHGPERVETITISGRPGWLLRRLFDAGAAGLTAADLPAGLRISGYIHKLRSAGVQITTRYEANSGAFGGAHGRFILASNVKPINEAAE